MFDVLRLGTKDSYNRHGFCTENRGLYSLRRRGFKIPKIGLKFSLERNRFLQRHASIRPNGEKIPSNLKESLRSAARFTPICLNHSLLRSNQAPFNRMVRHLAKTTTLKNLEALVSFERIKLPIHSNGYSFA